MPNNKKIQGAKGGSGAAAKTSDRSQANMRIDIALAQGANVGLVGGGQGIFLDGTPLVASDGSLNFVRASYVERFGLPGQSAIPGFGAASAVYSVNATVKASTPFVQGTSNANIDWVNVTLGFGPLYQSNTKANTINFAIDVQPRDSSVWTTVTTASYTGTEPQSVYQRDYAVKRPAGTSGYWNWRVRKIDAEPADTSAMNTLQVGVYTENTNNSNTYQGLAHVGLFYDAGSVGDTPPTPTFLFAGRQVRVPTNYEPISRTYQVGIWNQTFKYAFTDNPAWCLLDYLLDVDNGMGAFFDLPDIDLQSFYNASLYNDQVVSYQADEGSTVTGPRFRLNGALNTAESGTTWINSITNVMNANCCWSGGMITLLQDRPTDAKRLVNRSNMVWGSYVEKETSIRTRHTQVNITYTDNRDRTTPRILTIDADDDTVGKYDYLANDIELWGVDDEGQASRKGRWILDTEAYQASTATWQMGRAALNFRIFDVVKVMDNLYNGATLAGRVVSITGTTVVLDRPVTLVAGASDIDIATTDGTFETIRLNQAPGTYTTVTLTKGMTKTPYPQAEFNVLTGISPRLFRITKISEAGNSLFDIEAIAYDAGKWDRVENGVYALPPTYIQTGNASVGSVSSIGFLPQVDAEGKRNLVVAWKRPSLGVAIGYELRWRVNGSAWVPETGLDEPRFTLMNTSAGNFDFQVYANGLTDSGVFVQSKPATASFTIDIADATGSLLNAPVNLVSSLGNATFDGPSLSVSWSSPTGNSVAAVPLKNFQLKVIDAVSGNTIRSVDVPAVGSLGSYTYTFDQNQVDGSGTARRSVRISVSCRDANNKTSTATAVTFSNAAPAAVNSFTAFTQIAGVTLSWARNTEADFLGYLVWRGDTAAFTPSAATLVSDTTNFNISLDQAANTTKYYRIAAYDTFGKALDGTGLNVSGSLAATAAAVPGIASGAAFPTSPAAGDFFTWTTTNALYQYTGGKWVRQGSQTGTSAQMAAVVSSSIAGDIWENTTDGLTYVFNSGAWVTTAIQVPAANVTGLLTNAQLAAIDASKVTGTLSSAQIANFAIDTTKLATSLEVVSPVTTLPTTKQAGVAAVRYNNELYTWNGTAYSKAVPAINITGTLVDSQIAGIASSKLTGILTDAQLSAIAASKVTGQITNTQIGDTSISTRNLQVGSVAATNLAAQSVTAVAMAVGDFENFFLNGKGASTDGWDISGPSFAPTTGLYSSWITKGSGTDTGWLLGVRDNLYGAKIPVKPGDQFVASFLSKPNQGTNLPYDVVIGFFGYDRNNSVKEYTPCAIRQAALTGVQDISGTGIVTNSDTIYIRPWVSIQNSAPITAATSIFISDLQLRRKNAGSLIVDGSITANLIGAKEIKAGKLDVGAVVAGNVAAGAIQVGNLAADSVIAANIAAGAITTKQLAADSVTSQQLAIGDFTNLAPNADFSSGLAGWAYYDLGNGAQGTATPYATASEGSGILLTRLAGNTAEIGVRTTEWNTGKYGIPVIPGEQILIKFNTTRKSGVDGGNIGIYANYVGPDGSYSSGHFQPTPAVSVVTPGTFSVTFVVPAGCCGLNLELYWGSSATAGGSVAITNISMRRINKGELLVDGTITGIKIAGQTITGANIVGGTITGGLIAGQTITGTNIAGQTITGTNIAGQTITGTNISGATITGSNIAGATITGSNIAATTITAGNILGGTITGTQVAARTLTADKILGGSITGNEIAGLTISGDKIVGKTIDATKINVVSLDALSANVGTVTAGLVTNPSQTNYMNLNATGTTWAFCAGGGRMYARADGYVEMDRVNIRRRDVVASGTGSWGGSGSPRYVDESGNISYVSSADCGNFLIDTGLDVADAVNFSVNQPLQATVAFTTASFNYLGSTAANGTFLMNVHCEASVVVNSVMVWSNGGNYVAPRVYIRARVDVSDIDVSRKIWNVVMQNYTWSLVRV